MTRFIIEHASRGSYVGMDWSNTSTHYVPRFRWSIPRTDPQVQWWPHREHAERELAKVRKTVPKAYIVPITTRTRN